MSMWLSPREVKRLATMTWARKCLTLPLSKASWLFAHLGRRRVRGNGHRFDTLLCDLLKEIAGDSVERLHHHRSRWQGRSQLLCLAELVLATPPRAVAAVHHNALLWQALQGEGADRMGGHG